jgi:hypothetical protein
MQLEIWHERSTTIHKNSRFTQSAENIRKHTTVSLDRKALPMEFAAPKFKYCTLIQVHGLGFKVRNNSSEVFVEIRKLLPPSFLSGFLFSAISRALTQQAEWWRIIIGSTRKSWRRRRRRRERSQIQAPVTQIPSLQVLSNLTFFFFFFFFFLFLLQSRHVCFDLFLLNARR